MSQIVLSPNASGTGQFTIASPNSNTNQTFNLPDATGTVLIDGTSSQTLQGNLNVPSLNSGQLAGMRNKIINGNFDIWQRGTSTTFTSGGGGYTADRFVASFDGTIGSATVSQQGFNVGQYANTKYFLQWNQTVAGSGSTVRTIGQKIESVWSFSGQTVTLSFIAWADTARTVTPEFIQFFGVGGSPSSPVVTAGSAINLTTTPTRYTQTIAIPSISGKSVGSDGTDCLWVRLLLPINTTMTINIAQFQLEVGGVATPFEHRPIGTELALCQRYFEKGAAKMLVYQAAGTAFDVQRPFAVTKRAAPTIAFSGTSYTNASGIASNNNQIDSFNPYAVATALGTCSFITDWTAAIEL